MLAELRPDQARTAAKCASNDSSSAPLSNAWAAIQMSLLGIGVPAILPKRKLTFKEKAELAGIEDAISTAEQKVATLEVAVQDPALFKDRGAEVQSMLAELEVARADVELLFARWQELDAIPKE